MLKRYYAALCAASFVAFAAPVQATTVAYDNGSTSTNDCTPGCTSPTQTVYSGSLFGASPVDINSVSLYLDIQNPPATPLSFTLSTSKNGVGSLSSNFAANVGDDAQLFFSGVLSPATGWVTFTGVSPFHYDPTAGDLLVEIDNPSAVYDWSTITSSYNRDPRAQRAFTIAGCCSIVDGPGYAFNTRFDVSPAGVPEPASWALMLGGFGAIGTAMRRRPRAAVSFG